VTPERAREVERLYHEARVQAPADRQAFLDHACAGDEALRVEVDSLLAWREDAAAFLPTPASAKPGAGGTGEAGQIDRGADGSAAAPDTTLDEPAPAFLRRRPWWLWALLLPALVPVAAVYFVVFTAPQPVGWRLKVVKDDRRPAAYRVIATTPGTPAERAGFMVDDLLSIAEVERFGRDQRAGATYRFEIEGRGPGTRHTRTLTLAADHWAPWSGREGLRRLAVILASAAHFALAAILLVARPRDRAARWGALLFAQIALYMTSTATPPRFAPEAAHFLRGLPLAVGGLVLLGWSVSSAMPASAFGFCAVFPRPRLFTTRRSWPWWLVGVALLATTGIDLDFVWFPVYGGAGGPRVPAFVLAGEFPLGFIFVAWAIALFVASYRKMDAPSDRRRLRLVLAGFAITAATLSVDMALMAAPSAIQPVRLAAAWQFCWVVLLSAAALCTAYAILRHRVFDIHVIVRLGLRYAAARGVLLAVVPSVAVVLALDLLVHRSRPLGEIATERGAIYLVLVAAALALHVKRKPWMDGLDRRFFRERYDAYRLLAGVADDVRQSASFDVAAHHVMARVGDALHPARAAVMVRAAGETFFESAASIGGSTPSVPAGAKLVSLARLLGKPLENAQAGTGWLARQLPAIEIAFLRRAGVEWLFPVSLRGTGAEAFLLLGPKRSQEPYSREDRQLLQAVATSLGLLLERGLSSGFAECPACGSCYGAGATDCARDLAALVKSPYSRTLAGRYRFDRRLGSGGMGVVYEAFDAELKRQVAVKVIRPELFASPDALARFRREARIAARLSHPAVVSVHDFGVAEDGRAYIVMERLKGHTLREEMRERGALDPGIALEILGGVAEALALAHEQGLVHRDLKPENVFIERSGQRVVARVLDFGLAKPLGAGATETVLPTVAGGLLGTPAYMSPEQLRGDSPTEGWDVWALTVVAFEMLAGTHPLASFGHSMIPAAGGAGAVPSMAATALALPAREFFERAFAADSTRRPSSVRQVVEELRAALQLGA
jgi:hypothetical protein